MNIMLKPEELPESHFPLQNWELEKTDLITIDGPKDGPLIAVGLRDPGQTNAVIPVIERLAGNARFSVLADSRGKEILLKNVNLHPKTAPLESPLIRATETVAEADLVFTGLSEECGSYMSLTANAVFSGVPVVWIEDFPGVWSKVVYQKKAVAPWVVPTLFCVINEWSKVKELEFMPDGFGSEKMIITGQPADDRFASENRTEIRRHVREVLDISGSEQLLVYAGTVEPEETIPTAAILAKALQSLKLENFRLVIRRHPRDMTPVEKYQVILQDLGNKVVYETKQFSTDEIGIAADLLISNNSTVGIDAVYRGIPSLNITVSDNFQKSTSPTIEDGASPRAINLEEFLPLLQKTLFDSEFQKGLRQKMDHWKVDGHATDRVADIVWQLATAKRR